MEIRNIVFLLTSISALAVLGAATTVAIAQKPASPGATQQPVKPVESGAARLHPEHALLQRLVGTWDAAVTVSAPGAQATKSRGTLVTKAVGEAWVESDFAGELNGMPFSGHGVDGYDTTRDKFVGIWVDSSSTELMVFEGTHDEATKTTTMTCDAHDPQTGSPIKYRSTTEMKSPDAMTYQLSALGADGTAVELMRIEYKRRS
jgi:hypothetical protein